MPNPKANSQTTPTLTPPSEPLTNRVAPTTKIASSKMKKLQLRPQGVEAQSVKVNTLLNPSKESKCPQPKRRQVPSSCLAVAGRRKSSINTEIRRVAPKSDWLRKNVETSLKPPHSKSAYVSPYSKKSLGFVKIKPEQNDLKPVDGRRPVLKMPAAIPKPGRRKHKYVITVVGNEIKLLEPKGRFQRSDTSKFQLPVFNNGTTVSIRAENVVPKRRRKKNKSDVGNSKKENDDSQSNEAQTSEDGGKRVLKIVNQEQGLGSSVCCDMTVAQLNLSGDAEKKKMGKFSDRRTKMEAGKPVSLTEDEALLEKLDPISNILATEFVDSVQRCPGITDFLTEPTENPNPPLLCKRIFYDSTMMEEMNFPPLQSSDLRPDLVELPLVPRYFSKELKKTTSWPMMVPLKSEVRRHPISRKKRPKLETILATRPKGFHHTKWLEKTVASDSQLKTKLLRDVVVSQVKKLLKRQAELRSKVSERQLDSLDADSKAITTNT